jgi:DNA polymerase
MDARAKNRVKLYLRSERAMGLGSVRAPAGWPDGAADVPQQEEAYDTDAAPAPSAPVRTAAVAAQGGAPNPGEAKRSTSLFGGPVPGEGLMPPPKDEPFTSAVLPTAMKLKVLSDLDANEVKGCTRCRLHETRTKTVFGEGDVDAPIFFIGEGPGENEDLQGRPFVGRAGELLNKMIGAMGLKREQVYIANIVKCRPPGNRVPAPDEVATCTPYLQRQLEIIRPKVIVTLGLPSAQYMLQVKTSMGRLRGQWHSWRGIKLMPTYHPAYVLRSYTPEVRATVWGDLQKVMQELGLKSGKGNGPA